jgi:5S rRNA maturation endonuclease (ribonuclease M5)
MKFDSKLKEEVEKFKEHVILVEGKNDVSSLMALGFERVFWVHKIGKGLREAVEEIVMEVGRGAKVCILTDLDKAGKKLYDQIKPILQELGVKVDSTLRGILIKAQVSHIEGFYNFMKKVEGIGWEKEKARRKF